MGDSKVHEKLKKEAVGKPEWDFKVFTKPPSLTVIHMDEVHNLAEKELKEIMRGYLTGEFYEAVIYDEKEKAYIHVMHIIDLSRYTWLPKYMYRRFLKGVCDALGLIYRPQMLEAVTPVRLTPRAMVRFKEKMLWDKAEERAKELGERYKSITNEIGALEEFFKGVKKKK